MSVRQRKRSGEARRGSATMQGTVRPALPSETRALQATRIAAADDLTERFGRGPWSRISGEAALLEAIEAGLLYAIDVGGLLAGTFRLSSQKIAFYEEAWFADPRAPAAYLRDMTVAPAMQRRGVGRRAMAEIESISSEAGLRAVRLDAYADPAGAGPFYRKCGYRLAHAGRFAGVALEYYEKVL